MTVGPTTWLQGQHTIFGEVADSASRDVVEAIAVSPTDEQDRPLQDVVLEHVTIERGQ